MNNSLVLLFVLVSSIAVITSAVNIRVDDAVKLDGNYQLGVGIHDVTGPAAETGMMGYGNPGQVTGGLHFRLRARAFAFMDSNQNRAVYVSVDACMIFQAVKMHVVVLLNEHFGPGVYSDANVILSGTHTHSGPGGYSMYALYGITTLGFYEANFNTICDGIFAAIVQAHENLQPGQMFVEQGELFDSNINRSPTAYLNNPAEERAKYQDNVDKNMTVIRLEDSNGNPIAAMNIKHMNGNNSAPGAGPFIASFGQSNEGDVSPNTDGPKCRDGSPCDADSLCNGKNEGCYAYGPGKDGDIFESTKIIGTNQFQKALEMFESASTPVVGAINYRHTYLNMTSLVVNPPYSPTSDPATTCRPAIGYSFAAGTTDGPGAFDFKQDDNSTNNNPFWEIISKFIAVPTEEQIECQAPKPILIDVGLTEPLPWIPDIVPIQIITIGQIVLCAVPGEFSTMAGRRLREEIYDIMASGGMENPIVLIAGLANTYTGYITTYEEYAMQRFEGAANAYGGNSLGAYQQEFAKLAQAIVKDVSVPTGPIPRNMTDHTFFLLPPVVIDTAPKGAFGSVMTDVVASYSMGDMVSVVFYGANPRNNFMTEGSFLTVDFEQSPNNWVTILNDGEWDTRMYWKMHDVSQSLITIEWFIGHTFAVQPGTYRITHTGYAKKSLLSEKRELYSGQSSTFTVTA
eukprot:gene1471-1709_t